MRYRTPITLLSVIILVLALVVTSAALFYDGGSSTSTFVDSVRGERIELYGSGVYRHMSKDVAVQGVAQDYITLLVAVPLLLIGLIYTRKKRTEARLFLSGILLYFLITYMFYTAMVTYNSLYLLYVALLSASFFAFTLSVYGLLQDKKAMTSIKDAIPKGLIKSAGYFLIILSVLMGVLWIGAILPSIIESGVYPEELDHYTTLIVQGFDLALFIPLAVISGVLATRQVVSGYVFTLIFLVFHSVLMLALFSKLLFMKQEGSEVMPAIVLIPVLGGFALYFTARILVLLRRGLE